MQKHGPVIFFVKRGQRGFTLIELMVAVAVLAIGFVGVASMLTSSSGGNAVAIAVTGAASVASDQLEQLIGLPYDDANLQDVNGNGIAGIRSPLPPTGAGQDRPDPALYAPDYQLATADGQYTIYWNVAVNSPIASSKTIEVVVTSTGLGPQKTVSLRFIRTQAPN